jgi:DNA polymerase-3 subunit delta'
MSWNRIRGQDAARHTFFTAMDRDRLAHAYLLVGPDGVGKRLFARELAKAFFCDKPPAKFTACDKCPSCAQVEAETHPDLHFLRTPEDKQEIPVEAMREFCTHLSLKPTRGNRKIGIVETADDFNASSANSFLKTLEEPPQGALLLLIATSLDRQLPTILSRCQVVRFSALSPTEVNAILLEHGMDDDAKRDRLARLSGGSISRALAIDDDTIGEVRKKLIEGITDPRPNFRALAETWTAFYEGAGKDLAPQRIRVSLVLQFLIETVQQSLKLAMGMSVSGLDASETARLRAFADRIGTDGLLQLLDECVEADTQVERRVQIILVVEYVLDKFTATAK